MTSFYLLYYICICTVITFYECNYVKRGLKEMSFQITCFIMKLTSSSFKCWWIVNCCRGDNSEYNGCANWWLGGCYLWKELVSRRCFQCTTYQLLSLRLLNLSPHLFNVDRSSLKLVRKGQQKICPSCGGWEKKGVELRLGSAISHIYRYSCWKLKYFTIYLTRTRSSSF